MQCFRELGNDLHVSPVDVQAAEGRASQTRKSGKVRAVRDEKGHE
jgi:hypothetical protein